MSHGSSAYPIARVVNNPSDAVCWSGLAPIVDSAPTPPIDSRLFGVANSSTLESHLRFDDGLMPRKLLFEGILCGVIGDKLRRDMNADGLLEGDGVKDELRMHCCKEGEKHCRPGRVGDAAPV